MIVHYNTEHVATQNNVLNKRKHLRTHYVHIFLLICQFCLVMFLLNNLQSNVTHIHMK